MKRNLLFILISLTSIINAFSQWEFTPIGHKRSYNVDGSEIASFQKNIWIKTDSTWLSQDGGKSFNYVDLGGFTFFPLINDSTLLIYKYIQKYNNVFLHKSTDYGKTATLYYIIDGLDTAFVNTSPISLITFNDKTSVFMTTDSSNGCLEIWKTIDAANTWHRIPCQNINANRAASSLYLTICTIGNTSYQLNGETNNTIFKARDFGNLWEEITPNIDNKSNDFITDIKGIAFSDSLHGLMSYYKSFQNSLGITEDGGKSWKTLKEKYTYQISYAKATANNPGFYFARYYNPTSKKYGAKVSFNNGYDWKILDTLDYNKFDFKDAENGLCVVFKDSILQVGVFKGFPLGFASSNDLVKPLKTEVKIYPNPAKEILNIESSQDAKYECINISGQIIMSGIAKANQTNTLPISGLASGLYFLKFTSDNSCTINKFFVE